MEQQPHLEEGNDHVVHVDVHDRQDQQPLLRVLLQ
jgi:hypothetical protein